jgi:8-oxo-dGTP diphosphatase
MKRLVDACYRRIYRLVYPVAKVWWSLHRCDGVMVAVWVQDRVLVVRHSYKPGLWLPGGGVRSGEDHRLAVRRELHEEVGFLVNLNEITYVWTTKIAAPHRGHCHLYEVWLTERPMLHIDCREIIFADFVAVDTVTPCEADAYLNYIAINAA